MNRIVAERGSWYQHRWPWILMAGPAVVIVAGIVTAWIAATTSDGLVAEDYYKQGLAVNQRFAREERAAALRFEAFLRVNAEQAELRLVSHSGAALPARLRLTLAHPTRGGEDQTLVLSGERGTYVAPLAAPRPGHWRVVVEDEAATWRLSGNLQLPAEPQTILAAAARR